MSGSEIRRERQGAGLHRGDLPGRRFSVYPPSQKYSASIAPQITSITPQPSRPKRGAYRDRLRRGMRCGGRGSVGRAMCSRGGLLSVSDRQHARRRRCCFFSAFAEALARHAASGLQGSTRACRVEASAKTGGSPRTVKSYGPDASTLASRLAEELPGSTGPDKTFNPQGNGGKRARSPGRVRSTPLKPLACGDAGRFPVLPL